MRIPSKHRRAAFRAIGAGALLAMSIGLSGCFPPGAASEGGVPVVFCGFLYECGNHGGSDDNDPPPDPNASTGSSGGSSSGTGEEGTPETGGE